MLSCLLPDLVGQEFKIRAIESPRLQSSNTNTL